MNICNRFDIGFKSEIIGITGYIGAGKSVVSRILRCNGFLVYDCDYEASRLMNTDSTLIRQLKGILGECCYLNGGSGMLDRKFVSSKIFNDSELRMKVNSLVHEMVKKDFMCLARGGKGKIFVESAIMATSGLDKFCDRIWVIEASEETRIRRVMLRNKMQEHEARKRMETQMRELSSLNGEKVIIIENNGHSKLLETVLSLAFNNPIIADFETYMQAGVTPSCI